MSNKTRWSSVWACENSETDRLGHPRSITRKKKGKDMSASGMDKMRKINNYRDGTISSLCNNILLQNSSVFTSIKMGGKQMWILAYVLPSVYQSENRLTNFKKHTARFEWHAEDISSEDSSSAAICNAISYFDNASSYSPAAKCLFPSAFALFAWLLAFCTKLKGKF